MHIPPVRSPPSKHAVLLEPRRLADHAYNWHRAANLPPRCGLDSRLQHVGDAVDRGRGFKPDSLLNASQWRAGQWMNYSANALAPLGPMRDALDTLPLAAQEREVLNPTKEPVALADYNHGLKHERNTGVQGVLVLGDRKDAEVGEPILKSVEFAAGKWAGRKVLREGAT